MATPSGSALTQLAPWGGPMRRYGSFAGKAQITAPTVPGIEFATGAQPFEYALPEKQQLHFSLPTGRLHYRLPEED